MILFPNAKINLGLRVVRKRPDGYHDLETVFYPVPLTDILEINLVENDPGDSTPSVSKAVDMPNQTVFNLEGGKTISYSVTGLPVTGDTAKDLVIRACMAFHSHFGIPSDLQIHLHKIIPMGAGLGGGSSDAAFTLAALNRLCGNPAAPGQLHNIALELGSDCPFFLLNRPAFATGRGEVLSPLPVNLKGWYLLILKPDVHVGTADAFKSIVPGQTEPFPVSIMHQTPADWRDRLKNDFEPAIFGKYPLIAQLKNKLMEHGAVFASMSGSGSAVFGLFRNPVYGASAFESVYSYMAAL
jgi:4-diphosphocytidyl-2-C-methyl-D-erythritol kinase